MSPRCGFGLGASTTACTALGADARRVRAELLLAADTTGTVHSPQRDLAAYWGMGPRTLAGALADFVDAGDVRVAHGQIEVLDYRELVVPAPARVRPDTRAPRRSRGRSRQIARPIAPDRARQQAIRGQLRANSPHSLLTLSLVLLNLQRARSPT